MGHWMWQLLATLCVASSLALVALGGSNLLAAPPAIGGTIGDMAPISFVGAIIVMCEE
jgi:hypothetical protein